MKRLKINKVFLLTFVLLIIFSSTMVFAKDKSSARTYSVSSYESIDPFPMDGVGKK